MANVIIEGTWLPSSPDAGSHRLLPFDVPPGISKLDVRYQVEPLDAAGAHVGLDIGLFDPTGTDFPEAPGFRGWSGTFRTGFTLSPTGSTPGYLRGPIPAGTWHLLVGADAAMLGSGGLRYTIEITLTEEAAGQPSTPPLPYVPYNPPAAAAGHDWYPGNLHSHTFYSDGHNSIEEMADEHVRLGLRFGALTEHNILNPDLVQGDRPGFIWLPAEEVTTYRGHMNVWGLSSWLDFRCDDEGDIERIVHEARARGALTGINHPKDDGPPWLFNFYDADCMEVWQAPWFLGNFQSLALWESLLRRGMRIVAVGGSDLHRISTPDNPYPYTLDNPTTWVRAPELSVAGILEGISRGHVFISRDVRGPQLHMAAEGAPVSAMMGDSVPLAPGDGLNVRVDVVGGMGNLLRLITQDGVVHTSPLLSDESRVVYLWTEAGAQAEAGAYIRAEVIRDPGPDVDLAEEPAALWVEAMTNPIYVVPASPVPLRMEAEVEELVPVALAHVP